MEGERQFPRCNRDDFVPLLGVSVHGNHEEFIHEQIFIISNYKLSTAIRIQCQRRGDEGGELEFHGQRVWVGEDEKILEIDGGDGG